LLYFLFFDGNVDSWSSDTSLFGFDTDALGCVSVNKGAGKTVIWVSTLGVVGAGRADEIILDGGPALVNGRCGCHGGDGQDSCGCKDDLQEDVHGCGADVVLLRSSDKKPKVSLCCLK
jgi:hypothetical protein